MAHIKYRYFARLARAAGAIDVAEAFEATAAQEVANEAAGRAGGARFSTRPGARLGAWPSASPTLSFYGW
jgi:hypothetical protein